MVNKIRSSHRHGSGRKDSNKRQRATNNKMHAHFYIILPVIADFSDGNLLNHVYLIIQFSLANVRLGVYGNRYYSFGNKQTYILSTYPLTQAFCNINEFWSTWSCALCSLYRILVHSPENQNRLLKSWGPLHLHHAPRVEPQVDLLAMDVGVSSYNLWLLIWPIETA